MFNIFQQLFSPAQPFPSIANRALPPAAAEDEKDPLFDTLAKIVQQAGWGPHCRVTKIVDQEFGTDLPLTTGARYQVEGDISPEEIAAHGAWLPDKLQDALEAASALPTVDLTCHLSISSRSWAAHGRLNPPVSVVQHEVLQQVPLMSLCGPKGLILVVFSASHPRSLAALRQLEACVLPAGVQRLGLGVDAPVASSIPQATCDGWDAPAAKALNADPASPCAFLLSGSGRLESAGEVATVVEVGDSLEGGLTRQVARLLAVQPLESDLDDSDFEGPADANVRSVITAALPQMALIGRAQRTRGLTMMYRVTLVHGAGISRRLYVAGDVFPEAEEQFEAFGEWLDARVPRVGWRGCRHLTRPGLPRPQPTCARCQSSKPERVCLTCEHAEATMCSACAKAHPAKHPLLVLRPQQSLAALLLGRGHVMWFDSDEDEFDQHPNIACDACKGRMGALRYKNLCAENHDLCEECFAIVCELGTQAQQATFEREFNCRQADVFAELKTSHGVEFCRERDRPQEDASSTPSRLSTADAPNASLPPGHTAYSWFSHGAKMGIGHTQYSWG